MNNNEIVLSFYEKSTASDHIEYMFNNTDESGILFVPDFPSELDKTIGKNSLRCRMKWNLYDCENVISEFSVLNNSLKKIAEHYDAINGSFENARKLLCVEDYKIWQTYIKDYDLSTFDNNKVSDIIDRKETVDEIRGIAREIADGNKISDIQKEFISNYMSVTVTVEEEKYYQSYRNAIFDECEKRVGNNIYAYQLVLRAKRLCRLYSLNAPNSVAECEARHLAQALVLHKFCKSTESADYSFVVYQQTISEMTDDELDDYFSPKSENSRKSMISLFVYLILKEHSSIEKPLRQSEILKILDNPPYDIKIERKALSRTIHNLCDSQLFVFSDAKKGVWMAK